jgi:cellulose synthase/poly-beta-1,6-N-acetylglucosamine synthase-like glycosyltransferase
MLATWVAWAGVFFVFLVLLELLHMNLLLVWVLKREPRLADRTTGNVPNPLPLVTVIISAKDEERHIEEAARSILASDHSSIQLILVDDRSTDRTLEIMEDLARQEDRITVLSVQELPQGWTGKTHAVFLGTRQASGEILLFTDADTVFRPDAISLALRHFLTNGLDMMSLIPGFTDRGLLEDAVHPHLALGLSYFYPLTEVNDLTKPAAMASGCFIMISKRAYREVGTWETFKSQVTEDVALAKAVKAKGLKLGLMRGGELVRTRPFQTLSEVCSFWERTYYGALERSLPKMVRLVFNYASLVLLTLFFVFSGVLLLAGTDTGPINALFAMSTLAMAAVIIPYSVFIRLEHGNWLYGLMAPVGIFVGTWVAVHTLGTVIMDKGIQWRGSLYR